MAAQAHSLAPMTAQVTVMAANELVIQVPINIPIFCIIHKALLQFYQQQAECKY
jgi:hypothetical protein